MPLGLARYRRRPEATVRARKRARTRPRLKDGSGQRKAEHGCDRVEERKRRKDDLAYGEDSVKTDVGGIVPMLDAIPIQTEVRAMGYSSALCGSRTMVRAALSALKLPTWLAKDGRWKEQLRLRAPKQRSKGLQNGGHRRAGSARTPEAANVEPNIALQNRWPGYEL